MCRKDRALPGGGASPSWLGSAGQERVLTKAAALETIVTAAPSEAPLVEDQVVNEALRAATKAMREEMSQSGLAGDW